MNAPMREEIDARLEAFESRMEKRFASLEARLEQFVAVVQEQFKGVDGRFQGIDARIARLEAELSAIRSSISDLKKTVSVAAIAIFFGNAAINAAMLSNVIASFESGKSTGTAIADLKRQLQETDAFLKQLRERPPQPGIPSR